MDFSRRQFVRGGVAAFTWGFASPAFLSEVALAQGVSSRNLVVLYLGGGNDSLNTVVPYTDGFYYSRRPTIAVQAPEVLPIGSDVTGKPLGLHPRLTGLQAIYNQGRLAIFQRTGYPNLSRSHFQGTDIWSSANLAAPQSPGWLGRYLETLPEPIDPLIAWNTVRELPRTLMARTVGVPSIPNPSQYAFSSPNQSNANEALYARQTAQRIASHVPVDRPHLGFVNGNVNNALATLDRVATVAQYAPTVTYPNTGLGSALRAVAGAIVRGIGTKVFWVQTGGFDTHASQGQSNAGAYANLMATVNDAVFAFYSDMTNQSLIGNTTVLQFSEFARRVGENGSQGTDHGEGGVMMALGGGIRGGIYGTAPDLNPYPNNPTLSSGGGDVRWDIDFRRIYAEVLDLWLGANSVSILGGDYRQRIGFL
jgi:uncharacterized protein (DUF1501 family)